MDGNYTEKRKHTDNMATSGVSVDEKFKCPFKDQRIGKLI